MVSKKENFENKNVLNSSNHSKICQFNEFNNEVFEAKKIERELEININVNSLKIDFSNVNYEISSFIGIFNLINYALEKKDMDLFKFYICSFRAYQTKVDVNIDDYINNTENFLNLIELFEFYYMQNEISITCEIMWIFVDVFNKIKNTELNNLIFTHKFVKILGNILNSTKFEKSGEYFIYLCFMITGNAIQFSSSNKKLVFESNIATFIRQFFIEKYQNYSVNILKIICWVCSLFFLSSIELDDETVMYFYFR